MSRFRSFTDSSLAIGRWLGKCRVCVESSEDRDVLEKWFSDRLGDIDFMAADDVRQGGGGCSAVCAKVEYCRQARVPAVGIVDRDALFTDRNWAVLWQTDDTAFRTAMPYGPHVHVLLRWELENYLLAPQALAQVIKDARYGRPCPELQDIEEELREHWRCVVPIMAACAVLHQNGKNSLGIGYKAIDQAHAIEQDLRENLLPAQLGELSIWKDSLAEFEQRLRSFEVYDTNGVMHTESFLRIADGKRLPERVKARHNLRYELRGYLSRAVKQLGLIADELETFLGTLSTLPTTTIASP